MNRQKYPNIGKQSNKNNKKARKIPNLLKRPWSFVLILVIALIGAWVVIASQAATTLTPTTGSTATCGAVMKNYTYKVPFGNAPWNIPACKLPVFSQSADYVSRLYNHAMPNDGSTTGLSRRGNFNIGFGFGDTKDLFAHAVYSASEANGKTTKIRVCGNPHCNPSNFDGDLKQNDTKGYLPDKEIPWDPNWAIAEGGDNQVIIVDEAKGELITLSEIKKDSLGALGQCGVIAPERLCVSSAKVIRDNSGKLANYLTYDGSTSGRGIGQSHYATLLTPQEVMAGEIRHALGMGIFNTAFGPECTKEQLATNNWNIIGKTCSTAFAPATKFEWSSANKISDRISSLSKYDNITTLDKTVPEGMRFVLKMTDAEVETFIKNKGYTGAKANTTRIIIKALRDYGFMPVDTGGSAQFQVAGVLNPSYREMWKQLGITQEDDKKLLHGLFTETNMVVVEPPTSECIDGTKSQYYCKYTSSQYSVTSSSATTTTPTPTTTTTTTPTPTTTTTTTPAPTTTTTTTPRPAPTPTPKDSTPPTTPSQISKNLKFDAKRFRYNLEISWPTSTDNGSGIKSYLVTRNDGLSWTSTTSKIVDKSIKPDIRYTYQIVATDNSGNNSSSAKTSAKGKCALIWCWLE